MALLGYTGRLFGAALLFCSGIGAQTLTLSASAPTVNPGQQVSISVSYADSTPSAALASVQWNLNAPAGLAPLNWQQGAAATSAVKALDCNGSLCILAGMNINVIPSGVLAIATYQIPVSQPGGILNFSISGALGATAAGLNASFAGQGAVSITIPGIQPPPTILLAGSAADSQCVGAEFKYSDAKLPVNYPTLCFGPTVHYQLQFPPGLYAGSLIFVEPNRTAAGQRLMTVSVQGQTSPQLDIFAQVGLDKVLAFPFLALVSAGTLDILVTGNVGNAVLSGIYVNAPITPVAQNASVAGITVYVAVQGP